MSIPIIDSHMHLIPGTELTTIKLYDPASPTFGQLSIADYESATGAPSNLEGFIFIETDRKHDLASGIKDGSGWENTLMEVDWVKRLALGTPKDGEGHTEENKKLVLAIVHWAPLPSGVAVMERYLKEVETRAGESFKKVRGFRYLVQDKPRGTSVQDDFIESLKLLGRKGYVFDVAATQNPNTGGAKWQLDETIQMIERAHEGVPEAEKVTFVLGMSLFFDISPLHHTLLTPSSIDHMLKPDLSVYNPTDPSYTAWRSSMFKLSTFSKTYIKLSGVFPEMPESLRYGPVDDILIALMPYLTVMLATFGSSRIMYASDWPVCTFGVEDAWQKWRLVVERFCDMASLSEADQIMIWSGTAILGYGIEELMG